MFFSGSRGTVIGSIRELFCPHLNELTSDFTRNAEKSRVARNKPVLHQTGWLSFFHPAVFSHPENIRRVLVARALRLPDKPPLDRHGGRGGKHYKGPTRIVSETVPLLP